jgi:hypothetical protein
MRPSNACRQSLAGQFPLRSLRGLGRRRLGRRAATRLQVFINVFFIMICFVVKSIARSSPSVGFTSQSARVQMISDPRVDCGRPNFCPPKRHRTEKGSHCDRVHNTPCPVLHPYNCALVTSSVRSHHMRTAVQCRKSSKLIASGPVFRGESIRNNQLRWNSG